jgi:hypothetical protein
MTEPALSQRAVAKASAWLSARTSRRGFLTRSAVVGSALTVNGFAYLVKPQTAYASVCGPGSTCSSGWTVFCATINKGVNACPPGSIAAGWWKADGASLCGGRARYIIDCNATCSRCTTGSGRAGICSSSCWSCRCTCGPSGQCDNRRVCCNGFRYGQCNTDIRQVGGVHCRVVSCIPPWTFARCNTSPATDNRTRDHNSSALPTAWTPITAAYYSMGERRSPLGATVYGERAVPGGRAQNYVRGRISYSTATGARAVYMANLKRYLALGGEGGVLGFPTTSETKTSNGGAYNQFQRGRISWSKTTGSWETLGAITTRYKAAGYETGQLGYPTGPCALLKDGRGRASTFQRGRITLNPDAGAAKLLGSQIAARYVALGAEAGSLGYPVTDDVVPVTGFRRAKFAKGRILWSQATGPLEVLDIIDTAYVRSGAETGMLKLPTAQEISLLLGGRAQRFQEGRISARNGTAFFTRGPIWTKYEEVGAETGQLGYPTTDEFMESAGIRRNDFQFGSITHDEATGETVVTL